MPEGQEEFEEHKTGRTGLVGSCFKRRVHVSFSSTTCHPSQWLTACGWPYASWKFDRLSQMPEGSEVRACQKCLVRANLMGALNEEVRDGSDDSEASTNTPSKTTRTIRKGAVYGASSAMLSCAYLRHLEHLREVIR